MDGGKSEDTPDAFGNVVGKMVMATPSQLQEVIALVKDLRANPPKADQRDLFRAIEKDIFDFQADALVGHQAMDFHKQDGLTEIEESVKANYVERQLNDALLQAEREGKVNISRVPAFVGCVSNFSNFLDLSRKVLRNLELGVPVIILSRNNTTQHMFRWTQMIYEGMKKAASGYAHSGVDMRMVTYLACDRKEKKAVFDVTPDSPMYLTSSREVAAMIKKDLSKLVSSTGGPNTMVASKLTEPVLAAAAMSNCIENKGQCTAMRHMMAPINTDADAKLIYDKVPVVQSSLDSIEGEKFAGVFQHSKPRIEGSPGQYTDFSENIKYKIVSELPPEIEEEWRSVVCDYTSAKGEDMKPGSQLAKNLAKWLNHHQPITLALNVDDSMEFADDIFCRTCLVVYTVGDTGNAALTCQARPQDGEIFGEVPPRSVAQEYTHFPVLIPSSTPGYNTAYNSKYLASQADISLPEGMQYADQLCKAVSSTELRGFCHLLVAYLNEACGPKIPDHPQDRGRTAIFGIQRPPLHAGDTLLRADPNLDDWLAAWTVGFLTTNARDQVCVSTPAPTKVTELLKSFNIRVVVEDDSAYQTRKKDAFQVMDIATRFDLKEPPLAFHFLSLAFPMGHIKSVKANDDAFLKKFLASQKWLSVQKSANL